ncbi:cytochrome P450 6k1-like isoform X2 [Leptopilina boulardi]|uniref:cytochrome P450 6k1-like isoform X2 n=1 Tax=Leptopilina boulardi TaxID=63433 RepID=UPI0021F554FB|nr:cytochrome P450 6k1-like isoform X2 [Leptopilina boulardi]
MPLLSSYLDGIIFILLTLIVGVYFYLTRNFNYWKNRGVVEISPHVIFGNFTKCWTLKLSPGYLLKKFYEENENSPYVGIYIFDKPCLLVRDPEIIKRILIKDFNIFSNKLMRSSENDKLSNNCIFLIESPKWKYFKSNLSNLFTSRKLKNIFEYLQDVREDLNFYLDSLNLTFEKRVNVKELCAKFTIDVVGLTVLGLKLNCLRNSNAEFQKIVKRKMTGVSNLRRAIEVTSICLMPEITNFFDFRFFENDGIEFFKKPFQESLSERKKLKIKRHDLMDLLIQLRENNKNDSLEYDLKLEENDLLSQAMIFFLAGYDSSALTMSSTLYELARKPDIQNKLRGEINESLLKNNGKITYNMITDLPYLEMVILETLRMYPVLPIIDRIAVNDYKIEETGLLIEKGTPILIPMLGLHYDRNYFSNPNEYDPENFSDFNKSSRNPYVFMPFGIGPRSCIGIPKKKNWRIFRQLWKIQIG